MPWVLSRYRTGDLVEVRSREEILSTLNESGCLEGMPFMPEMLQYCGHRFHVAAVAHKTCDTISDLTGLRIRSAVHLKGLRCDGSAHDGCNAACNLFWKDAWLRAVDVNDSEAAPALQATDAGCKETELHAATRSTANCQEGGFRYFCQMTNLLEASERIKRWDVRQYYYDIKTRNHSFGHVAYVLTRGSFRWMCLSFLRLLSKTRGCYRIYLLLINLLSGRVIVHVRGKAIPGKPTPSDRLDLICGERVRIKSQPEIEKTLDGNSKNRGMHYDQEMVPYSGGEFRVTSRVSKIIDERTGKMVHMKQPSVVLDNVVCRAEYSSCRLLCPRAITPYWREIWLERVHPKSAEKAETNEAAREPVRIA